MADVNANIGQLGVAEVEIHDANGNPTDNWDMTGGITYTSTNPDAVSVFDDDANPKDARIQFNALTTEDVFIDVSFDGRVGDEVNTINLRSQSIAVVPGEAAGGTVTVRFVQL